MLAHQIETEIAASTERFAAALEGGDGAGAARAYADEAILLPPTGDVICGREAIERFWRSGIEIGLRAVELEPLGRGSTGSVTYEHGRYRMLLAPVDDRSRVERGGYLVVLVRAGENGSWRWAVNAFGAPKLTADDL